MSARGHGRDTGCQPTGRTFIVIVLFTALAGCGREQSTLNPAGYDASSISLLFWTMLGGAVVLWLVVNGAFYYMSSVRPGAVDKRYARHILIGGGIILPVVVLTALLVWGLSILPDPRRPGDGLVLRVTGEQWWWRVEYWPEGADTPVVSANEIRLPVGQRTEIHLTSDKVIHSFWIPALGGKMDMFPGRTNVLRLEADAPGRYHGICSEFCGRGHTAMHFTVTAHSAADFARWLEERQGND